MCLPDICPLPWLGYKSFYVADLIYRLSDQEMPFLGDGVGGRRDNVYISIISLNLKLKLGSRRVSLKTDFIILRRLEVLFNLVYSVINTSTCCLKI